MQKFVMKGSCLLGFLMHSLSSLSLISRRSEMARMVAAMTRMMKRLWRKL